MTKACIGAEFIVTDLKGNQIGLVYDGSSV
jgi:hypothetical protein